MYSPIACVGTLQVLLGCNCTRTYPQTQFCIPFECPPLPMAHPWSLVDAKCLGLSPVSAPWLELWLGLWKPGPVLPYGYVIHRVS